MTNNETELDRIINAGKVDSSTAMIVFAVELRNQGEMLKGLKDDINKDNDRYFSKENGDKAVKRIDRIENAILGFLGFIFLSIVGSLLTLIIRAK